MPRQKGMKTSRGKQSRHEILKATGRLIALQGDNQVTLDQVSEECGIAKSSILWHFGSKDELFLEVVNTTYLEFADAIINEFSDGLSALEKVTHMLNGYSSVSIDRPEIPMIFFSFAFSTRRQIKIREKIEEIYEWNRQAYMEHLGISENLAVILLGMVNGVLIQWLMAPDKVPIKELLQEMIPVFNTLIENETQLQRRST